MPSVKEERHSGFDKMYSFLALILSLFLLAFRYYKSVTTKGRLPGPSPLFSFPLIGHGYLLLKDPIRSLMKYSKIYGGIFRLDVGSMKTVFLCDHKLITEALKADMMTGRPCEFMPSFHYIRKADSKGNLEGPSITSGRIWQAHRKLMLRQVSDLRSHDNVVLQEAEYLVNRMKKLHNLHVNGFFCTTTNNIIWRAITGKATRQDDPEMLDLSAKVAQFIQALGPGSLLNLVQFSSIGFMKACSFLGVSNAKDLLRPMYEIVEKEVGEKGDDDEGCLIERCWAEIGRNQGKADVVFGGEDGVTHMVGLMVDYFLAGTDTVALFLEWSLMYLCQYPDIQEQVYQDICDCYGIEGTISAKDSFRLPFVEATVEEIYRHCPETVIALPHATLGDFPIGGHIIPKGTQVITVMTGVHMDPALFDKPEVFNPRRFIDENGNFKRNEHVLFYGYGKRKCAGERLGRTSAYLLFVTLFQKFKFSKVAELDFTPVAGLLFYPKPFDVMVERRC